MYRTLDIINILLGIVVIALFAGIASDRLALRLTHAIKPSVKKGEPVTTAARVEDLSFYAPILSSGLFGNAARGALSPVVNAPAATSAPTVAPAELLLLGTVVGSGRETFALVRHNTKKEERVFRLGEIVFDTGRLSKVTREQAFIDLNGKKVELLTPMTPPVSTANPAPAVASTGTAVANQGGGNFVIDQRALNQALDNPSQAMTDARLLPSQKDGKVEGFRASEVKPNGVFSMIGIKNGDVLLRLNDFPVDSPDKALQSFISLKGQNRLKLDMIRDGQPVTFNYDIR
jgi:general secretion pathway protein C